MAPAAIAVLFPGRYPETSAMQYRRWRAMPALTAIFAFALPLIGAQSSTNARVATPVCGVCHPKETAQYLKSAMGHSLASPEPLPAGSVPDSKADAVLASQESGSQMLHSITEHGLTAQYPVQYQIGAGFMGRTYMVRVGDYMFESPLSYFKRYGWDLSPGYATQTFIDFDRPIDDQCLYCHSSGPKFADADHHRLQQPALEPVTCDRCHGPTEAHVRRPSSANIINPAKLSGPVRDSVCEQCHLEGATRILNPDKDWSNFHAGSTTESVFATYVTKGGTRADVIAVSQAEQLAESKCVRASGGKLWCGSCHNPHAEVTDRVKQIRDVCLSCHTPASLTTAAHPSAQVNCISCHMPRNPTTDIPHAALTDHRLMARPAPDPEIGSPVRVLVWRDPAPQVRDRDLGLAETLVGFSKAAPNVGEAGVHMLKNLPPEQINNDPAAMADLEGIALQTGDVGAALRMARRSAELKPDSAKTAMQLAIVLLRSGDEAGAESQFKRAISLDISLRQAYMDLAKLYANERRLPDALQVINEYLQFNPQDIMFRFQRAQLSPSTP